jgi:hypothetical protein
MEKMSKSDERRLLKALEKAAMLSQGDYDPNQVLIKVSGEFNLTATEIARVVETYNKAKTVSYLKKTSSEHRASDFPVADVQAVVRGIFCHEKKAEENPVSLRNYTEQSFGVSSLEKAASGSRPAVPRAAASIWKEAMEFVDECKSLEKQLRDDYARCRRQLEVHLSKVASYCQSCPEKEIHKISRIIVNAYGEQGKFLINDLNARMSKARLVHMEKSASAVLFPPNDPYMAICDAFHAGQRLVAVIRNQQTFEKLSSKKNKADDTAPDEGVFTSDPSAVYRELFGKDVSPRGDLSVDPETGLQNEWSNYLKSLKARKMLYNMYRSDPIIKSFPLESVLETYNDLAELTPTLSHNKAWMRAAMRRALQQASVSGSHSAMDPFELEKMLASEKTKVDTGKAYADTVKNIFQDGDGERSKGGSRGGGGAKEVQIHLTPQFSY